MKRTVTFYFLFQCFSACALNTNEGADLVFSNFGSEVTLTHLSDNVYRYPLKKDIKVQVFTELIVKVDLKVTRASLSKTHLGLQALELLYQGEQFNYFLLTFKHDHRIDQLVGMVQKSNRVLLVQPNFSMQRKQFSTGDHAHDHSHTFKHQNRHLKSLNEEQLWPETKGQGVNVAIIDDGFDMRHDQLKHISPLVMYDADTRQNTAKPIVKEDSHGTKIAGVIFAHHDGHLKGLSPAASFIAIRQVENKTSNILRAFGVAKHHKADIVNASWNSEVLLEPVADVINDLADHGRRGRGAAVVFAAGNGGQKILPGSSEAWLNKAIVIGANNRFGRRLALSNFGPSVDAYLFGGVIRSTARGGGYENIRGTSLSASIASGLLTLLVAKDPNQSLEQLVQALHTLSSKPVTKQNHGRRE